MARLSIDQSNTSVVGAVVRRPQRIAVPALLIGALLAMWHGAVLWTATPIFPTPVAVMDAVVELFVAGTLWEHVRASLVRVSCGFMFAVGVGVPLGLWMGRVELAYAALNPLVQMFRPISPIAWIPLAILWFGIGDASPIFLIFLASVFPIIVQTVAGVHAIERRYLLAAQNFRLAPAIMFTKIVVRGALPDMLTGMRIGLGVAWLVVVAAEMIALHSGLGYLIMDSRNAGNRYDLVVAAMILIGIIGFALDTCMRSIERVRPLRWRYAR